MTPSLPSCTTLHCLDLSESCGENAQQDTTLTSRTLWELDCPATARQCLASMGESVTLFHIGFQFTDKSLAKSIANGWERQVARGCRWGTLSFSCTDDLYLQRILLRHRSLPQLFSKILLDGRGGGHQKTLWNEGIARSLALLVRRTQGSTCTQFDIRNVDLDGNAWTIFTGQNGLAHPDSMLQDFQLVHVQLQPTHLQSLSMALSSSLALQQSMKRLSLQGCTFSGIDREKDATESFTTFCQGLSRLHSLERLELVDCNISDQAGEILVSNLIGHATLNWLSLSGCTCGQNTIRALASLLSHPSCQLQDLDLSYQSCKSSPGLRVDLLLPGLIANQSLCYLNLNGNDLALYNLQALTAIASFALSHKSSRIQELSLTGNGMDQLHHPIWGQPGASCCNGRNLRRLILDENVLNKCRNVTSLVQLLKDCPSIVYLGVGALDLQYERIDPTREELEQWIDFNWAGRALLLPNAHDAGELTLALWPNVLARIENLQHMKHWCNQPRKVNAMYRMVQGLFQGGPLLSHFISTPSGST